jgi:hypothetical protein
MKASACLKTFLPGALMEYRTTQHCQGISFPFVVVGIAAAASTYETIKALSQIVL